MWMYELPVVMDLAGQVGIALVGRLQHDLGNGQSGITGVSSAFTRTLEPLVSL